MGKIAFIYPGQASQYVGMGKDLYDGNALAKSIYDRADDLLGFKISRISFEGPEEDLKQTRVTQPAIFIHSVIVTKLLSKKGITPELVAGHSLGEYAALVAAGAVSFEAGLELVKLRAELMQTAGENNPGTMAAILGLSIKDVDKICAEAGSSGIVQAANINSASQIVISGSVAGVEKAMQLAGERDAKKVVPLVVSGAFHSPLMESAQLGLKEKLLDTNFRTAKFPVYNNVTAKPITEPDAMRELLYKQLTFPVRWVESIENMIADGASLFFEVGPKNVLKGLLRSIDRKMQCKTIGSLADIDSL